jgi:orotate phosphoribosyltransferase
MTQDGSFPEERDCILRVRPDRNVPEAGSVRAASGTDIVTQDELLQLFRRSGALLNGHFRLTSGLHSPGYLQCALVLQDPRNASTLGEALAATIRPLGATVVLSPALGGIVIGHEVARALGVRAIFAERQDGSLQLRRGFALDTSDRVLVVEDVVTTGGSTRETLDVARAAGATPVGAAALVDRSAATADLGVPFSALLRITLPTYVADDCPLCAQGLPVVKPGSRGEK